MKTHMGPEIHTGRMAAAWPWAFYVGAGGHMPPPQIQKLAGKMYAYTEFVFLGFGQPIKWTR